MLSKWVCLSEWTFFFVCFLPSVFRKGWKLRLHCCAAALCVSSECPVLSVTFSRGLWDSICFMKKEQMGSLNLDWNCLDIVLAFGWVIQSERGVVFSLPVSLGCFSDLFCRQFFISLSLPLQLLCFHCPWHSFVPQWLCISASSLKQENQHWSENTDARALSATVLSLWIRYCVYVFINHSLVQMSLFSLEKETNRGGVRAQEAKKKKWSWVRAGGTNRGRGWRTVQSKQGNSRWKLNDVGGFSGSDWLSLWPQVFIIPSCDALISPFFCRK